MRTNWRIVSAGTVLIVLTTAFSLAMLGAAPRSNDPAAMMRTVWEAVGALDGLSLAMIAVGLIGVPVLSSQATRKKGRDHAA
jgi:hypothetical protein